MFEAATNSGETAVSEGGMKDYKIFSAHLTGQVLVPAPSSSNGPRFLSGPGRKTAASTTLKLRIEGLSGLQGLRRPVPLEVVESEACA